jgi:hypothetical protein
VWDDKEGLYRCESMANRSVLDSQRYTSLTKVRAWVSDWLKRIN